MLVDFYSDFLEVKKLEENISSSVIEFLKKQFSRYGIPETVVTDNGPQVKGFTLNWEFVHVPSSHIITKLTEKWSQL